ncbi:MAG TPA: hypothetical protein VF902_01655, partial [Coriobacteriia bacterium]
QAAEEASGPGPDTPAGATDVPTPSWLTRARLWTITGTVAVSAAAIAVAFVMTSQMSRDREIELAVQQTAQRSVSGAAPGEGDLDAAGKGAPDLGALPAAAPGEAPPYVSWNGKVLSPSQRTNVLASELTTAGSVRTALDSGQGATDRTAFTFRDDPSSVVLTSPDGAYLVFEPVVRMLAGGVYQLTTGVAVAKYGDWPSLPAEFPQPTSADGSPVFTAAGSDALGVPVFARTGEGTGAGFAVAPGTQPSDPAGGNPGWTWWSRIR